MLLQTVLNEHAVMSRIFPSVFLYLYLVLASLGHEFEQTLGDSEGKERLACCHPWGHKESDTT